MTEPQKGNVINLCKQIDELQIGAILVGYGIGSFAGYTIDSFQALTRRVTKQLVNELKSGIGTFLPIQYNYNNEFGNSTLESDLQNFITYTNNSSYYVNLEQILNRLIYYQVIHGFWDRGQRKLYSADEVDIDTIKSSIISLKEIINSELENLKKEREDFSVFQSQKNQEVQQIERNVNITNANAQEIATLLNNSIANNERIIALLSQQQVRVDESKQIIDERRSELQQISKDFEEQKQQFEEHNTEIDKKQKQFQDSLDFVVSKEGYFIERNEYLDSLIGREVGASLFETFKQRKIELKSPVNFWKWAVPAMSLVTVGWIFFLFKDFESISDINQKWQFFALSTLKTIPAIILNYFVINQYRKERNFQEEYAFKSAVALTISEYASKLTTPENKDKLIMESVSSVFISPIERRLKREEIKTNAFNETLKSIKEGLTEIADRIKK